MNKLTKLKIPENLDSLVAGQKGTEFARGFMEIVRARQQYKQHKETEISKRIQIQSNANIEIADIREKSQLLRDYLNMSFSERRISFDRVFLMLEKGLDSANDKQIDTALSLIVGLIKESPLQQTIEVMNKINSRNSSDIIEI